MKNYLNVMKILRGSDFRAFLIGGETVFIYPENLSKKPTLWFWQIKDLALIGILGMISIYVYVSINFMLPSVLVITYAILTIRVEEISILDFILYMMNYLLTKQSYDWSDNEEL